MKINLSFPDFSPSLSKELQLTLQAWCTEHLQTTTIKQALAHDLFIYTISCNIERSGTFFNPERTVTPSQRNRLLKQIANKIDALDPYTSHELCTHVADKLKTENILISEIIDDTIAPIKFTDEQLAVVLTDKILSELMNAAETISLSTTESGRKSIRREKLISCLMGAAETFHSFTQKNATCTQGGPFYQLAEIIADTLNYETNNLEEIIIEVLSRLCEKNCT